jgi:hypothetical protein
MFMIPYKANDGDLEETPPTEDCIPNMPDGEDSEKVTLASIVESEDGESWPGKRGKN